MLISIGISLIVIVMTMQVTLSVFFNSFLSWSEEFSRHLFVCITFLGISLSIKENIAIKFDIIMEILSERNKIIFSSISNILMLVFFFALINPAIKLIERTSYTTATTLPYSLDVIYSIILFSIILSILRLIQVSYLSICSLKNNNKGDEK